MITVEEASSIIQGNLFKPSVISVPLDQCIGMTLAEPILADRDFPPFDRVMMDGIAVNTDAFKNGSRIFEIEGVQLAGMPQFSLKNANNCFEVMTGAMLPKGTNAVIRYEDLEIKEGKAQVNLDEVTLYQNIHLQGADVKMDSTLLKGALKISTAEIGVLATVGKDNVKVLQPLKIAIVSTGDELVAVNTKPKEHQIRQSNSHVLKSALYEMGIDATILHVIDEKEQIKSTIEKILHEHDVVILSGGVSKGKKDYVPEVLSELEVQTHFHGVKQRPGKPFWFGTRQDNKTVFALPGNPVSAFMCFYKYIKPWINKSMSNDEEPKFAVLSEDFSFDKPLTYFLQVKIANVNGQLVATPVQGQGSGDLANLISADGFLELPANCNNFNKGEIFPFIRYR